MAVNVELLERNGALTVIRGKGQTNGNSTVSAKLTLRAYCLADQDPALLSLDERIVRNLRRHCALLQGNIALKSTPVAPDSVNP